MDREFRLLVAGGRDFDDREALQMRLYEILLHARREGRTLVVIHGAAEGADAIAGEWAELQTDVVNRPFPVKRAEWNRLGNMAPYRRNVRMLEEGKPHAALLCPGGNGTAHMRKQIERAGVPVLALAAKKEAA